MTTSTPRSARARIGEELRAFERSDSTQIAILTIPSLEGESLEDYSIKVAEAWKIGQKGKDNGVLLLLAIGDRRSRLELGYGLEPAITDGLAGDVLRSMQPYLRAGSYGDALLEATNEIGTRIAQAKNAIPAVPAPQPLQRQPHRAGLPSWVIPVGIFAFFLLMSALRGRGGGRGGGSGSSTTPAATWPPKDFTNVTNVSIGAYALGSLTSALASTGGQSGSGGDSGACAGLFGVVRDFKMGNLPDGHPDFRSRVVPPRPESFRARLAPTANRCTRTVTIQQRRHPVRPILTSGITTWTP